MAILHCQIVKYLYCYQLPSVPKCFNVFSSAGKASSITGHRLSVCLCVNQGGINHIEICNPVCTDLLIHSDHKPKTSSVCIYR